jgi:3-deoxy-7-phosphoheptulonate synthase/chorismate mutase
VRNEDPPLLDADQLQRLRGEIDELNVALLRLLESRGRLVRRIMSVKQRLSAEPADPAREDRMITALIDASCGVYTPQALERMFRRIFEISRALAPEEQVTKTRARVAARTAR